MNRHSTYRPNELQSKMARRKQNRWPGNCKERNTCWNRNRLQGVTVIDLFDVVCLRCNDDDDDEAAVELCD